MMMTKHISLGMTQVETNHIHETVSQIKPIKPKCFFTFFGRLGLLEVPAAGWQVASTATTPSQAKLLLFDNQCT